MNIEELIREHIDKTLHLSLATCVDNKPWVCEVHFAYDDDLNLYFRSKPERRHSKDIDINQYVAGNIVQQFALEDSVVGVYFEGVAQKLTDVDVTHEGYKAMNKRNIAGVDTIEEAKTSDGHQFYRIIVKKWALFGSFDGRTSQKYELEWKNGL